MTTQDYINKAVDYSRMADIKIEQAGFGNDNLEKKRYLEIADLYIRLSECYNRMAEMSMK